MVYERSNNFDLPTILKLGDLNVRAVADNNPSLSVEEYFDLFFEFVEFAPTVKDALALIANFGGDKNAFKSLANIQILLREMGCEKFITVIGDIVEAGKNGNMKIAADGARIFLEDFNRFCIRTMLAQKTDEAFPHADSSNMHWPDNDCAAGSELTLKKALEQLYIQEATRKLRILAVDDSYITIRTIIAVLGGEYKVYGLTNQMLFEKALHDVTPELFLLDYNMPGRNGLELIPIIRSFDEHKHTPIIFVTSMGTSDNFLDAVELGACDFVVKPIRPDILREKVEKHIVRKKLF